MKKTHSLLLKRMAASVCSLALVVALFPAKTVFAAEADPEKDYRAIMKRYDDVPDSYDPESADNPYGHGVGEDFALYEFQELLHFCSTNLNASDSRVLRSDWTDYVTDTSGSYTTGDMPHASYMQAVAFDPYGTGQKDCVAFVGWEGQNAKSSVHQYILWVLNTKTGQYSNVLLLSPEGSGTPNDAAWVEERDIPPYMMTNFLSVTAGDYDGDGCDSVVVYVIADDESGASRQPLLMQAECARDDSGAPKLNQADCGRMTSYAFLNQNYLRVRNLYENGAPQNKLGADLVSGDFNGDGIDDLACLSYFNNLGNNPFNSYVTGDFGKAQLSVGLGGSGKYIGNMDVQSRYLSGTNTGEYATEYQTVSFTAASLAAGDINNDGAEELVAAGYPLLLKRNDLAMNQGHMVIGSYSLQQGTIRETSFEEHGLNNFSMRAVGANDAAMSQMQTNCVAFDGFGTAEQVLVNDTVYNYNGAGFTEYNGKRLDQFNLLNTGAERFFISSVAVGVFDGNTEGKEEAIFIFGEKYWAENAFSSQLDNYIFYRVSYKDSALQDFDDTSWLNAYGFRGDNLEEVLNNLVVPIDRDDDVIKASYVKKECVWSDPKVIAVLQAAPYYGELGGYGDFDSGETTFSYSQIYSEGSTMEQSESVGRGIAVEGSLSVGLKFSMEAGKTKGWSQSFENSVETGYTSSFTATAQNSVILSRTPVVIYRYDLDYAGSRDGDSIALSVPLAPLNTQVSVDVYNNFAKYYNQQEQADPKLNLLEQSYLNGNEGNPRQYQSSWGTSGVCFSKSGNVLGTDGGAAGVEYAQAASVTNGTTTSEGFHFGMSAQAGFGTLAEFWGGTSGEYDRETAIGHYTTNAVEQGCSGSVANIDSGGLNADYGIPVQTAKAYSFSWTFGKWNWNADRSKSGSQTVVPILGYVLTNLNTPIAPVTITSVDFEETESRFRFTWAPSAGQAAAACAGYRLYRVKGGGYQLLTAALIPPEQTEYALSADLNDTLVTFVMTAVDTAGCESVWSNEVAYVKGPEGRSAYEVAVENGFEGTEEAWLASLVGKKGRDGIGVEKIERTATQGAMDTYTIYFTDKSTTTFTVTNGADGTDGTDGRDGRELQLRAVAGTIQWKYDTEDVSAWRELLTIDGSEVTLAGLDGADGADGREIELRKNEKTGFVQWHYAGEAVWTDLMPLAELKGEDAREVEFKAEYGSLMWRYLTAYSAWRNAGTPAELLPEADPAKALVYRVDGGYLQWRYADESSPWASFRSLEELTGSPDSVLELMVGSEKQLQWREIKEDEWKLLGIASNLKGDAGTDGRDILLRADANSGYLQWQYAGEERWHDLIALADLQGVQGEKGTQGEAGRGIVSIAKTGTDGLADTYTITYTDGRFDVFTVANGEKGAQGIPGEKGPAGQSGADGKDGRDRIAAGVDEGGERGQYTVSAQAGEDGAAGVGISDIRINDSGELIFTMTDGSRINAGSYADALYASPALQGKAAAKGLPVLWGLSVVSLLWNGALTAILLVEKKKSALVGK